MIATGLFVVLLVIACRILYFRYRLTRTFKRVPGPPGNFLLGNALELLRCDTNEFFEKLLKFQRSLGNVFKIDMATKCWVVVADVDDIERIISSNEFNKKSDDYDQLHEWLGNGILVDYGHNWFVNRRALTGAFHFKILDNYVSVFDEQADVLVQKLLETGGTPTDVFAVVKLYTLDVILETSMGIKCVVQLHDSAYVRAVSKLSHITFWRMYNILGLSDVTFRFTKYYRPYVESLQENRKFVSSVIKARRTELVNQAEQSADVAPVKQKLSLLDILLRTEINGKQLTDKEIEAQVNTFMFAGHDTTSSALTYLLYALAKHPHIQQRAFEEVNTVVSTGNAVKPEHITQLKYIELVIKETLRMFPSVPYFSRTVEKDTTFNGIPLLAGTTITFGAYLLHHNPKYFEEPEEFRPERFEDKQLENPFLYIPFSAGTRNCIGQKFAMNELKTVISKILQKCRIELADHDHVPRFRMELILKPVGGMHLRFFPRE